MNVKQKKALIIGGSMSGLFAGNLLHRADWEVTILEKSSVPLVSRGTGIATHPGLIKALQAAGAQFDPTALGVDTDRRFFSTQDGKMVAEMVVPQQMTTWARLLNALVRAFPAERYHLGQHVTSVTDGDAHHPARVHLSDGRVLEADLVIAADGMLRPVSMLALDHAPPGERVISANSAQELITMLEAVVAPTGTGKRAAIRNFHIAGKTGTTRKSDVGGYAADRHGAIFAGIAPARSPRLVVVVMIDEPQGQHYGGPVAGPVFANVAANALRALNVPPDSSVTNIIIPKEPLEESM